MSTNTPAPAESRSEIPSVPIDTIIPASEERVGAHTAVWDLLKIALPTIATMTSFTLMQFWDKLTVSRIAADPIYVGAQGNGGLTSFVPIAIAMGFLTVINTYVAQNLGAGKPDRAPRTPGRGSGSPSATG